jgi:deoxyribodipyrimidine photolyase-related protein
MTDAALVLRDQLNQEFSYIDQSSQIVMIESTEWADKLPHHKKKIVLHFSAMRHFADDLVKAGKNVIYFPMCDDVDNAFLQLQKKDKIETLHVMEPSEWGVLERIKKFAHKHNIKVKVYPNEQFLYQDEKFNFKKPPLLETFYRYMRKRFDVLMEGKDPVGGTWNFDKENRQKAPDSVKIPHVPKFLPDKITKEVIKDVNARFEKNFGSSDDFEYAVTRKEALEILHHFIEHKLKLFGPYQDAMMTGENVLFHSVLSPYLNINLIRPLEVIQAVETAYKKHKAPLASVEGFIRQVLGWREFVYQVYKANMPEYKKSNFFKYKQPLPYFYWDAKTNMHCMKEAITPVIEEGINHHIQRLMVTGNFALIAGIDPHEVNDWYHFGYMDALDWVVTPNVLGLSLYADGGMIATKPYAASAGYIQKMSNYCKSCPYNPKTAVEDDSCPFNSLYWHFIDAHQAQFKKNPRMSLMVELWNKKEKNDKISLLKKALAILKKINNKEII